MGSSPSSAGAGRSSSMTTAVFCSSRRRTFCLLDIARSICLASQARRAVYTIARDGRSRGLSSPFL
jgi:hypothetical protein